MSSAPPPVFQRHFPILDSLRAVGAFAVLVTHVGFWSGSYTTHSVWGPVLARLDVGVAIFFVLSGFLLSRPWLLAARQETRRPAVPRYALKRVLRIYPLYLVTAVFALTLIEGNRGIGLGDWLTTLALADVYQSARLPPGLAHMWSLAVEVAFYAVLPLLMWLAVGRRGGLQPRRVWALLTAMVAINIVWICYGSGVFSSLPVHSATLLWLPSYLTWFAIGIGLALLEVEVSSGTASARVRRWIAAASSSPGSLWVVAGALLMIASTPLGGPVLLVAFSTAQSLTKHLLYAAIGGLLVFTGVFARPGGGYVAAMSHGWSRHIGVISYGVFCIHLPVLHLIMSTTGWQLFGGRFFTLLALTTIISLAAAELLYRLVERPALRLVPAPKGAVMKAPSPATTTTTK